MYCFSVTNFRLNSFCNVLRFCLRLSISSFLKIVAELLAEKFEFKTFMRKEGAFRVQTFSWFQKRYSQVFCQYVVSASILLTLYFQVFFFVVCCISNFFSEIHIPNGFPVWWHFFRFLLQKSFIFWEWSAENQKKVVPTWAKEKSYLQ